MAFDKNVVSTKKHKYFGFNIDVSPPEDPSLPPTPSAIVGITPEKVSSMFWFPCHQHPHWSHHSHYFCLVWHLQYVSGFCYVCFYCRALGWPVFFVFRREEKNIFTLSMPLRLSPCVVFAQVHCSGKFRKVLEAAELWKVRFSFPLNILHLVCTPPNTPRAPQTLGLATVRSFVCGRGGLPQLPHGPTLIRLPRRQDIRLS